MKSDKKIAFLGLHRTFRFNKIGGIDSFIRRLSIEFSRLGIKCYLVTFHSKKEKVLEVFPNVYEVNMQFFKESLNFLVENGITETIVVYIPFKERLNFIFTNKNNYSRFHPIITVYNSNIFKRFLLFGEAILSYKKGIKICLSSRIFITIKKFSNNTLLLLPPVDDNFFNLHPKNSNDVKKIAFMGRLDYGKGADIAVDFFEYISKKHGCYECYVFGYPWSQDPFSIKLHNSLKNQTKINYVETKLLEHDENIDNFLKDTIDTIDLFILPYRFMHSTIDTPLVPLELLARGKNFIGSKIGVLADLVPDINLLINKECINNLELTDKVQLYFTNYHKYHNQNIRIIDNLNYSTTAISKKLLQCLQMK